MKNANKKVSSREFEDFVNPETGETLVSQIGCITSINTRDEDYMIIDSKEYYIMDIKALTYLQNVLTSRELYYVHIFCSMCGGEYNTLQTKEGVALDRKSLLEEMNVARTTFLNTMTKLHKEGVISYLDSYVRKNKKVKYVVLNPTLARRRKRIRKETVRLFWDLTKEN